MSSSPTTMMSDDETSNEYQNGADLSDQPGYEDASEMSDESTEPEPEGLTFYHMDLYECRDRLEIFPDDQFIKGGRGEDMVDTSETMAKGDDWASSSERAEQALQREVEELARMYGLDEDREVEGEGEFFGYCAPPKGKVSIEQPPVLKSEPDAVEMKEQTEEQDRVEDISAEQSSQETNKESPDEDLHNEKGGNADPSNEEFLNKEPLKEEPDKAEPLIEEPRIEDLAHEELGHEEPHSEEAAQEEHANEESLKGVPCCEEPREEETGNEEPGDEDTSKVETGHKEPHSQDPGSEETHNEEQVNQEPCGEQPQKEEPSNKEQTSEEPHSDNPCCEESHTEETHNEKPSTEEPHTEEPQSEEPYSEEPHNEEPPNNVGISDGAPIHEDAGDELLSFTMDKKEEEIAIECEIVEENEDLPPQEEEEVPDIFCVTCKTPIRAFEKLFGSHKEHEVTQLPSAVEDFKDEIHKNMCSLEEQIAQMENFAGHLEEIFITVEENFARQEQNFEMHYTEIMHTLTQRYDEKTQALEEEKKEKLEALYGQLVDCGKILDNSKDLMETIQELFKSREKVGFVKTAVHTIDRLEEFLKADVDLQMVTYPEYENKTIDFSEVQQLLDSINTLPAPSAPVVNPQTPNSATGTSVKVCWSLFSDDTVESYQLFYKPVSDDTPSEAQTEFVVNVKETYCTVDNLVPNTQYEFWVTALNTTGIGPASEKAVYVTAPSPPLIKFKHCRSCENAALICWESGENVNPVDSYMVELCRVTNEDPGTSVAESIVGIPTCESLIQLQPNETYDIYVRAANVGGPSERSLPVTIHTTGTFFHLNANTAHPLLSILDDGLTISCDEEESLGDLPYHYNSFTRCIAVMGNLIPLKGKHYWEVDVEENTEYRIGVAFEDTNRNGYIGANNTSWCMRHVVTPSRHKYEFLHCGTTPDVRITIPPQRIGILLDYDNWKLCFFNMDPFQHLHTFDCHFQHLVHPCFALEKPGILRIRNGIAIPKCVLFL
ncbi:fibronectin type III and SPRY domain-containing protein 2 [Ambystoma mexicanum]|uniref:fibronectin type III and SPRY domain-containing protein 2 n=1 Tax=Ambystoma mexicanum TaxID=8296 RepID=UPI0037E71504